MRLERGNSFPFPFALLVLLVWMPPDWSHGQSDPVEAIHMEMQEALRSISSSNSKLDRHYEEALGILLTKTDREADRKKVEMLLTEMSQFRKKGDHQFPDFPELAALRKVYDDSLGKIEADRSKSRLAILNVYEERFRMLKKELESEGEVELSIKADRRMEALEAAKNDPAAFAGLLALWKWEGLSDAESVNSATVERRKGNFVISSTQRANTYFKTGSSFSSPFEIATRLTTDSTNIRFYVNGKITVIFNWEVRPDQLRLHDPTPGSKPVGISGKGFVKENVMHDIRILVKDGSIQVYADEEFRGEITGDFSNLKGQVGIGPAFGSTLTVESFEVLPLTDE